MLPSNAFIDAAGVIADADKLGYSTQMRDGYADEQHYRFAPDNEPNDLSQYSDAITNARRGRPTQKPSTHNNRGSF